MGFGTARPAEKRKPDVVLRPPRFGVVAFENPRDPRSGIACTSGSPAKMFGQRTELASDVVWITDAPQGGNLQNFRPAKFLRATTAAIAQDLGVDYKDMVEGLPAVAKTVGAVRDLVVQLYPWTDLSNEWKHSSLSECIASVLPPLPDITPAMEAPLRQSLQSYSAVPDQGAFYDEEGPRMIHTLRMNRLRYANFIMQQLVPANHWLYLPPASINGLKLDIFLDQSRPSLVEVSIEFDDDATGISRLVAFGADRKYGRAQLRKWVTQPELAWLVEHARVHIQSAYLSEKAEPIGSEHALPPALTADPVFALSVSAGLIAESHWNALANGIDERRQGAGATVRYVKKVSSTAAWLRAFDRAYCFQMAKHVTDFARRNNLSGLQVTGYGYGQVSFWASKVHLEPVRELARELGAAHPCLTAMERRMMLGTEMAGGDE